MMVHRKTITAAALRARHQIERASQAWRAVGAGRSVPMTDIRMRRGSAGHCFRPLIPIRGLPDSNSTSIARWQLGAVGPLLPSVIDRSR
jgi:hypothetical protein